MLNRLFMALALLRVRRHTERIADLTCGLVRPYFGPSGLENFRSDDFVLAYTCGVSAFFTDAAARETGHRKLLRSSHEHVLLGLIFVRLFGDSGTAIAEHAIERIEARDDAWVATVRRGAEETAALFATSADGSGPVPGLPTLFAHVTASRTD
jgi:hypothetical protein